ncbi:MAG TPA: TIGR03986 family CRISPR-associated RAMP protein [Methanosarcina sp.]|nr:TIGR03986 family CRISPR-associated RAMP protein [Methanosarcina sp.]
MLPKHSNPTKKRFDRKTENSFWAYAPYNFIPLPDKLVTVTELPDQDSYTNNTGYIKCTMKTESPLYVRCPMTPSFFNKYGDKKFYELSDDIKNERAQFFYYDHVDLPIIPGSTLRGMIRSLVEIVGYGKIQWVTDKKLVYRAVGDSSSLGVSYRNKLLGNNQQNNKNQKYFFEYPSSNVRGGYLKKDGSHWSIQPAREIYGETFVHIEYSVAQAVKCDKHYPNQDYTSKDIIEVYIRPPKERTVPQRSSRDLALNLAVVQNKSDIRQISEGKQDGFEKAIIVRSGHMGGRTEKHMHCAIYEPDTKAKPILIPNHIWSLYSDDRDIPRGISSRPLCKDGDPLFYLVDDKEELVFLGPTMMFRLPYDESVIHFVPEKLRDKDKIDISEAIFGYESKNSHKTSCAGRVFFTDAKLESLFEDIWLTENQKTITPKILASPKPTTFQHYLVQDESHDPDQKVNLAHYATPSPDGTVIRGHKMYWHKGEVKLENIKELDRNIEKSPTQYTKIKPIKSGVTFSFRIYFENLRDFELGALLWVLTLPGEKGKEYRHSLGMGKPFGMGTIKIEPELYECKRDERYQKLFEGDSWYEAVHKVSKESKNKLIKTFENHMLDQIGEEKDQLNEVDRIKILLYMMEWKGPSTDLTRYLQIHPINEYKERPVLPDPFNISPP